MLGCDNSSGPPSIKETSEARPLLVDRIKLLEQYVTFRREYEQLEYDIVYRINSAGLVAGPSEWDVRLIAVVPENEVHLWRKGVELQSVEAVPDWVLETATSIDVSSIKEWYVEGRTAIGIDEQQRLVAYRNVAY